MQGSWCWSTKSSAYFCALHAATRAAETARSSSSGNCSSFFEQAAIHKTVAVGHDANRRNHVSTISTKPTMWWRRYLMFLMHVVRFWRNNGLQYENLITISGHCILFFGIDEEPIGVPQFINPLCWLLALHCRLMLQTSSQQKASLHCISIVLRFLGYYAKPRRIVWWRLYIIILLQWFWYSW